jgi:hypothetical protein
LGEQGFELLQNSSSVALQIVSFPYQGEVNLYEFVQNQPTLAFDALGLAPIGPNSQACKDAMAQAKFYQKVYNASKTTKNLQNLNEAIANAIAACKEPPKLPPCPPPPIQVPAPNPVQCRWIFIGGVLVWACIIVGAPIGV